MKETCEALGVSRQMVQKLETGGELKAIREGGRVFFDAVEVEALRTAREIAKVERQQEAEEREFQGLNAEADRHDLEFAAWSKTFAERQEQRKLDDALGALTKELRELREAEERRQRDLSFSRLLERRPVKSDSYLFEVATGLAPAAAVLLLAYLARDKTGVRAPQPATETVGAGGTPNDVVSDAAGPQREADACEHELIEKLRSGTATEEDVRALAILMGRRMQCRPPR